MRLDKHGKDATARQEYSELRNFMSDRGISVSKPTKHQIGTTPCVAIVNDAYNDEALTITSFHQKLAKVAEALSAFVAYQVEKVPLGVF